MSPGTMPEKIGEVGGHEEKAREGSSTPVIETPAVGARADVRPRVTDGGGEGTRPQQTKAPRMRGMRVVLLEEN